MTRGIQEIQSPNKKYKFTVKEILDDYRLACRSRFMAIIGRKEVLTGKAGFGVFGDGVEIPQIACARAFHKGDFRAGYYRDQSIELALKNKTVSQLFSQLYGDTQIEHESSSAGRQMNNHFASRLLDKQGQFKNQTENYNTAADISPTAGQMNRLLGLAYASKLYRQNQAAQDPLFTKNGDEVVFGSIGDASTSEGYFFECMNAAGVLQVPLIMSVWDNGFGISVPRELQTVNNSISKALSGFTSNEAHQGFSIYCVEAWNYLKLREVYLEATENTRKSHKPALIHVTEVTQPQGHSTSGSHERYKSKKRLDWEKEYCCLAQMRKWLINDNISTSEVLDKIESEEQLFVKQEQKKAWDLSTMPIETEKQQVIDLLNKLCENTTIALKIKTLIENLKTSVSLTRKLVQNTLFKACLILNGENLKHSEELTYFFRSYNHTNDKKYTSHLYSESLQSPLLVPEIKATYSSNSDSVDGRIILLRCFDHHLSTNNKFFIIGEDVGKLGDVNLVFDGLNPKFGDLKVTDTGIREASILGQGIGAAIRGLRPLVDIQYLDYFLYALQTASDDLATLLYRTVGGQKAPVIIRTKGHRLEGIWHTGSPISVLLGSLRGLYLCVPRNMTQAAGFYNTLLQSDNPALVIEVLNGYRLKEILPNNISAFTVPLGVPEILREGTSLSIVTYGACCRIALEAADELAAYNIYPEIIDVQTLLPYDINAVVAASIAKTNAVLFFDEDLPGGATAYMMQKTLERDHAFHHLDVEPRSLTAVENRAAFGRDGDYYCKPQVEHVFELCYEIMRDREPKKYPNIFAKISAGKRAFARNSEHHVKHYNDNE